MIRRVLLTLLVVYTVWFGATYDGILDAQRRLISMLLLGALVVIWLVSRRQGRWRWFSTPLDTALLVWGAAFALSLLTNLDAARRISIGLWFMALYVGVWYVLQDVLANRALRREWLVDALLIAGVPVLFVGYAQGIVYGLSVRPVGTLGNANALAALLVLLLPLGIGRLRMVRTPLARVLLLFYSAAALGLIGLSFSRGGWIGAVAALATWIALSFPLRRIWTGLPRTGKIVGVVAFVLAAAVGVFVIVQTLGIGGRGIDFRTYIYETATQMFSERPLSGYGVFTFGAGLSRLNSIPPVEPHSHAHNVILNVAAEMGIVGLLALALTAWAVFKAIRRADNPIAIMGAAAFVGFAAHQMFDLPAMMPVIALAALVTLVLAAPAAQEASARRVRWQPALLGVGGIALAVTGIWNAISYGTYVAALSDGVAGGDLRAAGERLQPLIDADPTLAIYAQQQGMLYGLGGDLGQAQADFERYTQLEPNYASGWANLAAIYEARQSYSAAEDAMRRAVALAPESWSLMYRFGNDAEAAGNEDSARNSYQRVLALNPDARLLPDWDQSPLRAGMPLDESKFSAIAQTLRALERGDTAAARQIWDSFPNRDVPLSANRVIDEMLALSEGDPDRAASALVQAQQFIIDRNSRAWTNVGAALVGDYDAQREAAGAALDPGMFGSDWDLGTNINYIQYLSLAIQRQFLPQVLYSEADPALLYLLGDPDALANIRTAVRS